MTYRLVFLFFTVVASLSVEATQRFTVKDGDQIKITISRNEISRLAIEGKGRLAKAWSPKGYLDMSPDVAQGEGYFKAAQGTPNIFSFFARDDLGNTYTIIATQENIPSQTIMLAPLHENQDKFSSEGSIHKTEPLRKAANALFKAMFLKKQLTGFVVQDVDKEVPLWSETKIRLIQTYSSTKFKGEVYEVINLSDKPLDFHESEFFDFGDKVLASGMEHLSIKSGMVTRLFVVRNSAGR